MMAPNAFRRNMTAYVCTYRRKNPSPRELRLTNKAAADPLLRSFLDSYEGSYYDWGDDPSFFSAEHFLGDVRRASWGVCRPDVRRALWERDVVVFFCGSQEKRAWRYYFVGFGTVLKRVERAALWTDAAYSEFRRFYNVLARLDGEKLVQSETFHSYHKDWERRARAPYVLFDRAFSHFNLRDPHCVATWDGESRLPERWFVDDRSRQLEALLFTERNICDRRLRTSASGFAHSKLNLTREGGATRPGRSLQDLTQALVRLV